MNGDVNHGSDGAVCEICGSAPSRWATSVYAKGTWERDGERLCPILRAHLRKGAPPAPRRRICRSPPPPLEGSTDVPIFRPPEPALLLLILPLLLLVVLVLSTSLFVMMIPTGRVRGALG